MRVVRLTHTAYKEFLWISFLGRWEGWPKSLIKKPFSKSALKLFIDILDLTNSAKLSTNQIKNTYVFENIEGASCISRNAKGMKFINTVPNQFLSAIYSPHRLCLSFKLLLDKYWTIVPSFSGSISTNRSRFLLGNAFWRLKGRLWYPFCLKRFNMNKVAIKHLIGERNIYIAIHCESARYRACFKFSDHSKFSPLFL